MSIAQAHERAIAHLRHDLSPEEQQARSGNPRRSCPRCGRAFRWRRPRYRRADGRPVAWVNRIGAHRVPSWLLHQASATVAECSRCGGQWLVFAESVEPQRGSVRFDEQERYWEDGATQTRTIDNSRRNSELKQSEGFAHEWRASVTVGKEVGTSESSSPRWARMPSGL